MCASGAPVDLERPESELNFARPPIIEAVVERRFANSITREIMNALRRKFEHEYPAVSQMSEVQIALAPDGSPPIVNENGVGYRLVNREGTAIVVLSRHAIAFARLAPYPGWADFNAGAAATFRTARDIMEYSTLSRIGVRYINRLDIPIVYKDGCPQSLRPEHYVLIYPEYPESAIPQIQSYAMQCVSHLQDIECQVTINVATVPAPVPGHTSIVFDIDIGRDTNIPQRGDEISALMDNIRREKNRLFISCLTDKMKEHFK